MKYRLIVCAESDYNAWKNDEMLLDINTNNLVDIVDGVKMRHQNQLKAITYSEFKELTEHVDKKVVNGVVALLVKDVR